MEFKNNLEVQKTVQQFQDKIAWGDRLYKKEIIDLGAEAGKYEKPTIAGIFKDLWSRRSPQTREEYLMNRAERFLASRSLNLSQDLSQNNQIQNLFQQRLQLASFRSNEYEKLIHIDKIDETSGDPMAQRDLQASKRQFLAIHAGEEQNAHISQYTQKFPFIQQFTDALAYEYAQWQEDTSENDLEQIQNTLIQQHKNIGEIIRYVKDNPDAPRLQNIILETDHPEIEPYMKGERKIDGSFFENLHDIVKKSQEVEELANVPTSVIGVEEATENASDLQLRPIPSGATNVVLKVMKQGQNIAFIKKPRSGDAKLVETLEKFVRDVAHIFGKEKAFASHDEKIGGVELSQISEEIEFASEPFIDATLISYVFGMFDAHLGNIVQNADGTFSFFDPARSFPHSNVLIHHRQKGQPIYKSGLLSFNQSYRPLTEEEREFIKKEITIYKQKFASLKQFVEENNPDLLPPTWFDQQKVLQATQERIDGLEKAVENPSVVNLGDLILEANPEYKFFAVLQYLSQNEVETDITTSLKKNLAGLHDLSVSDLIQSSMPFKIGIEEIKRLAIDTHQSFAEIIHTIYAQGRYAANDREYVQREQQMREGSGPYQKMIDHYESIAPIDKKDLPN